MAESQPEKSEKTEPPSPFKLEEARKKGSVAKSMEINHLLALGAAVILLWAVAGRQVSSFFALCRQIFSQAGQLTYDYNALVTWGVEIAIKVSWILAPLFAVMVILGVLGTMVQTGPVFSFFPLKPDIKRLNPIAGFKRLFSMKLMFEFVKSLLKLVVLTAVVYVALDSMMPDLFGLTQKSPQTAVPFFLGETARLIFKLVMALLLIALLDLLFTRWEFMRNMRMTKREVKDEVKRREGDPHIRSKRKEIERELRKRAASAASVPQADLIITNPDHYAVVVRYDRAKMAAPIVTGKGVDAMAQHLKDIARVHQVPIVSDPPLARRLYRTTGIGDAIPEDSFIAVARVLRQAYLIRRRQGRGAPAWATAKVNA